MIDGQAQALLLVFGLWMSLDNVGKNDGVGDAVVIFLAVADLAYEAVKPRPSARPTHTKAKRLR